MAKPTLVQVIQSVLAAFIGVQKDQNRKRDFEEGSLMTYLVVGLVFTAIFVGAIVLVVSWVVG